MKHNKDLLAIIERLKIKMAPPAAFTCSKSKMETVEKCSKYVQS